MTETVSEESTIIITSKAVDKILSLMAERGVGDHYLRVFVDSLGCSGSQYGMAFSKEPRKGDVVVESNEIRVLVDPLSLMCLDGATVDYVDTPEGPNFRIDNPNEISGSACGSCGHDCKRE